MNLFEVMREAGGGQAFSGLARQYGMSEDDIRKAVEAFLPAFSVGLKRKTADPLGLMEFMRRLGSADYMRAYLNPEAAAGAGQRAGEDALAFLFGGPEAWKALAGLAGTQTGIPQGRLAEMLPSLAAMMFGGLAKQGAAVNPVLAAMLRQLQAGTPDKPARKGPLDRLEEAEAERTRSASDSFAEAPSEMMRAGLTAFQAGTAAWQKALGEAMKSAGVGNDHPTEAQASGREVFGEMFEPGLRLSEAYRREMEAVLDRLRPETKRS